MTEIDEHTRNEERGKRIALIMLVIAGLVFGFVWLYRS
jgi:hypothetical protein